MISIFAKEYEDNALDGRNAEAKEYQRKMEALRCSETFLYILRLLQLLEPYAEVSLDA